MAEFVWKMCDGSRTFADIEDQIRNTFSVSDRVNLRKDLQGIIHKFSDIEVLI